MKSTQRLIGLALAMLMTTSLLGGIDRLAHEEYAAAAAHHSLAQTPAAAAVARA